MDRDDFEKLEKLYHYTSFDKSLKILASNKLRFGKLNNMNDIHESYRHLMYDFCINEDDIRDELKLYRQLSLVRDKEPRRGFDIPAMWAHYADNGCGVCLVFDKEKLLSSLHVDIQHDNVAYDFNHDGSICVLGKSKDCILDTFMKEQKKLFFTKTSDWSYEQEYRLLVRTHDSSSKYFLDYKDSLIAIILNFAEDVDKDKCVLESVNVKILNEMQIDIPILELGYWDENPVLRDEKGEDWMNPNKNRVLDDKRNSKNL